MFQSTHPCKVRPRTSDGRIRAISCFNPRTRVRCDDRVQCKQCRYSGFNPRTPVRCDVDVGLLSIDFLSFQSTHPCKVRLFQYLGLLHPFCFNPRTPVRCDCLTFTITPNTLSFNPRTPVRCDNYPSKIYED